MSFELDAYLIASPFSYLTDLDGTLTENIFFDNYFVELQEYQDLASKFDSLFNRSRSSLILNAFLFGYSGTGKTTFVRWFFKTQAVATKAVFFDFADVTDSQHEEDEKFQESKDGEEGESLRIFDDKFKDLICAMTPLHFQTFRKIINKLLEINPRIRTTFSKKFFVNINKLKDLTSAEFEDNFIDFVLELRYQDLLLILLLFYYYQPKGFFYEVNRENISDNDVLKPLTIIFDNIDHIDIESTNAKFPKRIQKVHHNFKQITRIIGPIEDHNTSIRLLFCMRDSNYSILSRQVAELQNVEKVYFFPSSSEREIIQKRIEVAEQGGVVFDPIRKEILEYIFKDDYTKNFFLPLFNLNYRKLALLLANKVLPYNGTYLEHLKYLSKKKVVGSRGIIYYLIIEDLLQNDYLKDTIYIDDGKNIGGGHGGHVNPPRIILTNLLNLTRFSLERRTGRPSYTPTGLFTLYESFRDIFENEPKLFVESLAKLFLSHKKNWCHLVSFSNKRITKLHSFEDELEKLMNWEENNSKIAELTKSIQNLNNSGAKEDANRSALMEVERRLMQKNNFKIQDDINRIHVSLNPAGYIYIKDIIKHYEFFSIKADNPKPLFACYDYSENNGQIDFEFLENLDSTFAVAKECVESLNKFLDVYNNRMSTNRKATTFETSEHIFRCYKREEGENVDYYENKIGRLLIIRIIHTHISYIDDFRIQLLSRDVFWQQFGSNKSEVYNIKSMVNSKILDILDRYIALLRVTHGEVKYLHSMLKENMDIIRSGRMMHQLNN